MMITVHQQQQAKNPTMNKRHNIVGKQHLISFYQSSKLPHSINKSNPILEVQEQQN
jgi:hypothetical protein